MRPSRVALASLLVGALVAAGCTSDTTTEPVDPATAQATDDPAAPPPPADATGLGAPPLSDPPDAVAGEQVAGVSMAVVETHDPFEPVREPDAGAEDNAASDGATVPTAPTDGSPVPTAPTSDVPVLSTPTGPPEAEAPSGGPTPEPDADVCAANPDACLTTLRLIDAGTPPSGPGILQVGTTMFEVEVGAQFADVFVLLELRDSCATVAHPDGVVERCVEAGSSLK